MRDRRARAALGAAMALAAGCLPPPAWRAVSPDHGTRVVVKEGRGRTCVTVAARAPACHDAVNVSGLAFAARGGSVAWAARDDGRWRVVHDGRAGEAWAGVGAPVLSADGARIAHAASDGASWRVVVDGVPGAPFDSVVAGSIAFDSAGRRVAYAAWRDDSAHVTVDGVTGRGWRAVERLAFAPGDGAPTWVGTLADGAHLVVGDSVGPPHAAIGEVAWARGVATPAYAARDAGAWRVTARGRMSDAYDEVRALAWLGAGDDARPVFVARAHGREAVVVDGAPHAWHGRVDMLAVARDGARWGYVADGTRVLLDGRPLAEEHAVTEIAIADDGGRWAYVAAADGALVVVDERGRHRFDLVIDGTLQFVDGGAWACVAGDRARRALFVVVDGRATTRRLDWAEVVRLTQRHGVRADAALRAWVAAEARLAVAEMVAP